MGLVPVLDGLTGHNLAGHSSPRRGNPTFTLRNQIFGTEKN